jgi:hypothetical protein
MLGCFRSGWVRLGEVWFYLFGYIRWQVRLDLVRLGLVGFGLFRLRKVMLKIVLATLVKRIGVAAFGVRFVMVVSWRPESPLVSFGVLVRLLDNCRRFYNVVSNRILSLLFAKCVLYRRRDVLLWFSVLCRVVSWVSSLNVSVAFPECYSMRSWSLSWLVFESESPWLRRDARCRFSNIVSNDFLVLLCEKCDVLFRRRDDWHSDARRRSPRILWNAVRMLLFTTLCRMPLVVCAENVISYSGVAMIGVPTFGVGFTESCGMFPRGFSLVDSGIWFGVAAMGVALRRFANVSYVVLCLYNTKCNLCRDDWRRYAQRRFTRILWSAVPRLLFAWFGIESASRR